MKHKYKRILVKIGTKVLSTEDNKIDIVTLKHLVEQIVAVMGTGTEVVVVTSGAKGVGRGLITLKHFEKTAEEQVLAAVGQVSLMNTYSEAFGKYGQLCAQVLATKEDFRDETHYFNMHTCFENLLASGVVPIVNENDVVATTELLFTDNDELAGLVASQLDADAVVILTSVEGLLNGDPKDRNSAVVSEVDFKHINSYRKHISTDKTEFGQGGMFTKFKIAKKLTLQGIAVHFANGKRKNVLTDLMSGKGVGTTFVPCAKSSSIKRRIAYSEGLTKGAVQIKKSFEDLLISRSKVMSVLPKVVIGVRGDFNKGDIVEIVGKNKKILGFGIAGYNAGKVKELMGIKRGRPIVHRNHLFISE